MRDFRPVPEVQVPLCVAVSVVGGARTAFASETEYTARIRAVHGSDAGTIFPSSGDGDRPIHHGGQLVGSQGEERD